MEIQVLARNFFLDPIGQGKQLVAVSKQLQAWNFKEVFEWAGKKSLEWHLVPNGGQHFNRQEEKMIGVFKKQSKEAWKWEGTFMKDLHTAPINCPHCQQQAPCRRCPFRSASIDRGWFEDGRCHGWCALDSIQEGRTANWKTSFNQRSWGWVLLQMGKEM